MKTCCQVFQKGILAGTLQCSRKGYMFTYDIAYLSSHFAEEVSYSLPLREAAYQGLTLFPCFAELLPKGRIRGDFAHRYQCDATDSLALLIHLGRRTVGTLSFRPIEDSNGTNGTNGTNGANTSCSESQ